MAYAELFESILEPEIEDAEEETFWLYSQPIPSSNLGFVDPKASTVDARVGGVDYTIHQSPGVLSSDRAGGTTGAVLWKISPVFADWLSSPTNFLFASSPPLLDAASAILELGCGISPLNAFALAPRVASHTLTDQAYVQRLLQRTLDDNSSLLSPSSTSSSSSSSSRRSKPKPGRRGTVSFETLDWETDELPRGRAFDAVLACDCVYNYALIPPLVQTCVDACRRRQRHEDEEGGGGELAKRPSLCIVAQQLRNDDVFKSWLEAFVKEFRVWRVADDRLPETLRPSAGFVIHVGILRE
ncbi:hypothetical protein LMH87_006410 [Akanthomyces muscarius]|uniref:Diaminohydroxyphosphoribosylamino-pyrimidine deaminase n=1 Tax=Akanthomyces muscarius TaxID=2231603 RepID=A0A9W8QMN1_AKAMU|nr:hypothetical protein LMH87_006410 [Akanthomyces muscarius]KAJ4164748.1 hypothetical protein LMH87_006410 [Akanthomyces muscarius]